MYNFKMIGLGCLFILLSLYYCKDQYLSQTKAKIEQSKCNLSGNRYLCSLIISYVIKNTKYTNKLDNVRQKFPLEIGEEIPIFYNPINPSLIQYGFETLIISFILLLSGTACIWFGSQVDFDNQYGGCLW